MIQSRPQQKSHFLALIFAAMLLVMVVVFFLTFAYGAYMVYNNPISNVFAETRQASSGGAYLYIYATGFNPNTQKIVWVDPQFSPDNSSLVNPSSGYKVGYSATDPSGAINQNFTLPGSLLHQISSDGSQVHHLWIIGVVGTPTNAGSYSQAITTDSQENYSVSTRAYGIAFFVTLFVVQVPVNFNLGQLFIVLWIIYALLFAMALNGPFRSVIGAISGASRKGVQSLFDNSLLGMFAVFPVVLWGSVLLEMIQAAGGISTGNLPPADPLIEYVGVLLIAPLREEIGFRVIPIGVVAFLIIASKGRWKDALMGLWHPSRYLKKVDSVAQYRQHLPIMYLLIAISAGLFGLAHVLFGAGWGIGKISEAAGAGVALGALYFKYGLPSAILLHWTIDVALQTVAINNTLNQYSDLFVVYTGAVAIASSIVLIVLLIRRFRRPRHITTYPMTLGRL